MKLPKEIVERTIGYYDKLHLGFPSEWGWGRTKRDTTEYEIAIPEGTILTFPNGVRATVVEDLLQNLVGTVEHYSLFHDDIKREDGAIVCGTPIWDVQVVKFPREREKTYENRDIVALTRPLFDEERKGKILEFHQNLRSAVETLKIKPSEAIKPRNSHYMHVRNLQDASQVIQSKAGEFIDAAVMSCHGLCNLTDKDMVHLLDVVDFAYDRFKAMRRYFEWTSIFFGYGGGCKGIPYRMQTLAGYLKDTGLRQKYLDNAEALINAPK